MSNRVLPEILGYVGAALVASAALNLVSLSWEDWSDPVRLSVLVGATTVLAGSAVVIAAINQGRLDDRKPDAPGPDRKPGRRSGSAGR
jgi:Predicted membrane protein (DUF2157).